MGYLGSFLKCEDSFKPSVNGTGETRDVLLRSLWRSGPSGKDTAFTLQRSIWHESIGLSWAHDFIEPSHALVHAR